MRNLVRIGREDTLLLPRAGDCRIDQQDTLERENRTPVFHRTEKLALAGTSDIIELGQWIGGVEIIVEIGDDLGRCVERILALWPVALADDDADFGRADLLGDPVEFAEPEEQQVGRHFRASLKGNFFQTSACSLA